jgi:4-alpha-glucanotransferase
LQPNEEGPLQIRERLRSMTGLTDETPVEEVITRTYGLLAQAPSAIVVATLEDALGVQERPNVPGTTEQSWVLALPVPLDTLKSHSLAHAIAEQLRGR